MNPSNFFHQLPFEEVVQNVLATVIVERQWRFYLDDEPRAADFVVGNKGFLPVLLWEAEKFNRALGSGSLGVGLESDPACFVGAHARIDVNTPGTHSRVLLFCLEALARTLENNAVLDELSPREAQTGREHIHLGLATPLLNSAGSLDAMLQSFREDHEIRNCLPWLPTSRLQAPDLQGSSAPQGTFQGSSEAASAYSA